MTELIIRLGDAATVEEQRRQIQLRQDQNKTIGDFLSSIHDLPAKDIGIFANSFYFDIGEDAFGESDFNSQFYTAMANTAAAFELDLKNARKGGMYIAEKRREFIEDHYAPEGSERKKQMRVMSEDAGCATLIMIPISVAAGYFVDIFAGLGLGALTAWALIENYSIDKLDDISHSREKLHQYYDDNVRRKDNKELNKAITRLKDRARAFQNSVVFFAEEGRDYIEDPEIYLKSGEVPPHDFDQRKVYKQLFDISRSAAQILDENIRFWVDIPGYDHIKRRIGVNALLE